MFNSYVNIPTLILTSDKDLYMKLLGRSLFVKAEKGNDPVRIITKQKTHNFKVTYN
ncbi:MAG TPA: hypothetical protein VE223_00480 [Nitrososphaeraceae archaeon]|nr:hypothetical protein [Nitrososphaeraceae archaeon]